MLEIRGCIVTIDAMGTQTEIAKKIVEKGADYILALKGNQGTLFEDVKLFMEEYAKDKNIKNTANYHKNIDKGHGRNEIRECYIYNNVEWIDRKNRWKNLQGIGMIWSHIEENGIKSEQKHYFIYSLKDKSAKEIMKLKRNHWSIENNLHWVLDMAFREDESRARMENSAENFNVLRHIALNILKSDKTLKGSITDKQFKCLLDEKYFERII